MPQFPPFPTWDSLHPMIIHFPIVLLLVSPLFLLISTVLPPAKGRPYMLVALLLLLLGTGSLFVAAASGEAAGRLAERGGPVDAVLESHEDLATQSEVIFSVLSVVMLGIVALPRILRREETRLTTTWIPLSFLVLYCVGILFVVNTAHAGGRLVHEFGVHAIIPAENNHSIALPDVHESARMDEAK
jgi:uncharacterized membrane protein